MRGLCAVVLAMVMVGCVAGPDPSMHGRVAVDADDGFGSLDVVTLANVAGPELLNTDFVASAGRPLTIAVAPVRNAAQVGFDANLFLRRLRLELNRQGRGKLRFVAQGASQRATREAVREDGRSAHIQGLLDGVAKEVAALPTLGGGVVCAMLPTTEVNFVNLNAESYLAMLRTKVVEASGQKVRFLLPGTLEGADYYLYGQFVADSDKTEGIVNLADYIRDLEQAEREGKSLFDVAQVGEDKVEERATAVTDTRTTTRGRFIRRNRLPYEAQQSPTLRERPRVAKYLNVMIVDAKDKTAVYERQLRLEDASTGMGAADYILSAELSDIVKDEAGTRYVLVTIQLIDPATNTIVWETGHEVKFEE